LLSFLLLFTLLLLSFWLFHSLNKTLLFYLSFKLKESILFTIKLPIEGRE